MTDDIIEWNYLWGMKYGVFEDSFNMVAKTVTR